MCQVFLSFHYQAKEFYNILCHFRQKSSIDIKIVLKKRRMRKSNASENSKIMFHWYGYKIKRPMRLYIFYLQSLWHQAISSRITTNSFHFLDIKFPEWRMEIKEFKTKMIFQRFCYLFNFIYIIFFLNWQWVEHDFTIYRVLWFSFPASLFIAFRNLFPYDGQTLKTYYSANCYSTAQYSIHQETINFHAWHFSCIVLTG